jgi:hypothetical protein
MAKLIKANKPTSLVCLHNIEYEMPWNSDEPIFQIAMDKKHIDYLDREGYRMHPLVPEILVWSKSLHFQTIYIARKEDFDELEMF